jgi:hypothetical protein
MYNFKKLSYDYLVEVIVEELKPKYLDFEGIAPSREGLYAIIAETPHEKLVELSFHSEEPWYLFPIAYSCYVNTGVWPHEVGLKYVKGGTLEELKVFILGRLVEEEKIDVSLLAFFDIEKYIQEGGLNIIKIDGRYHYFTSANN